MALEQLEVTEAIITYFKGSVMLTIVNSNGNPGWTKGPPLEESILEIRSIDMYFNRTSTVGTCH